MKRAYKAEIKTVKDLSKYEKHLVGRLDSNKDMFLRAKKLSKHPIILDNDYQLRYKENRIVRKLLEKCKSFGYSLNDIWNDYDGNSDDIMRFYRDIGYSLSGFEEIFSEACSFSEKQE